jgi:hypothetical protein
MEDTVKYKMTLSDGSVLEVEATPAFLAKVRQQLFIHEDAPVEDEHVKKFVCEALKGAVP